jgi:glycosyltransferase involved in cell wall biosynthesis
MERMAVANLRQTRGRCFSKDAEMCGRDDRIGVMLLIDHLTSGGGAQSIYSDIITFGDRGRFQFSAVYWFGFSVYTERLRSAGASEYFLGHHGCKWLSWLHVLFPYRLIRLVRSLRPSILHVHAFSVPLLHGVLCKLLSPGLAIVYTQHCSRCQCSGFWRWWQSLWLRWYDFVATDLEQSYGEARDYGVANERIQWIPFGVRTSSVDPADVEKVRREVGWRPGDRLLLSVARLTKDRRIDSFIRAIPGILASHHTCKLVLVGGGKEESNLRQLAIDLGIAERVIFTGPKDNPFPFFTACDLYLTMAIGGEVGVAGWQAALCGKPVVAIVSDYAKDTSWGEIQPFLGALSVEDISRAVVLLLSDDRKERHLAENGRKFATENHRANVMAERYMRLYAQLLDRKNGR